MAEVGDFWTAEEIAIYLRPPQSTVYTLAQDKIKSNQGIRWKKLIFWSESLLGGNNKKRNHLS
jgi:hypothetical protein